MFIVATQFEVFADFLPSQALSQKCAFVVTKSQKGKKSENSELQVLFKTFEYKDEVSRKLPQPRSLLLKENIKNRFGVPYSRFATLLIANKSQLPVSYSILANNGDFNLLLLSAVSSCAFVTAAKSKNRLNFIDRLPEKINSMQLIQLSIHIYHVN